MRTIATTWTRILVALAMALSAVLAATHHNPGLDRGLAPGAPCGDGSAPGPQVGAVPITTRGSRTPLVVTAGNGQRPC